MTLKRKIKYIINLMILISVICALCCIAIMCIGARMQAEKENAAKEDFIVQDDGMDDALNRKIDFEALKRVNEDVIGWIYIPETRIDYPILQSNYDEQEDFYLNKDLFKEKDKHGSIYIRKENAKDFSDSFTVVYGHKMKDGSMFAPVHDFKEGNFLKAHNKAYIYTPQEIFSYDILKAVEKDSSLLSRKSLDLANEGTYIALSTCGFPSGNKRVVLICKKDM